MLRYRGILGAVLLAAIFAGAARAQDEPPRPWWIGAEVGEGQLRIASDQAAGSRKATFALGFVGGRNLGRRARVGLELHGWLLQASNLNDPTAGESVSHAFAVVDLFPLHRRHLFIRGGTGVSLYGNRRPGEFGGHGWGWAGGAGYEIPARHFIAAPMLGYSAGRLGDAPYHVPPQTGRRYSVLEFKLQLLWNFGKPKAPKP